MSRTFELLVTVLIGVLGAVAYVMSGQIRGMAFDPLGPKAVPEGLSVLLVVLAIVLLGLMAWRSLRPSGAPQGEVLGGASPANDGAVDVANAGGALTAEDDPEGAPLTLWSSALSILLVVAFVLAIFEAHIPVSLAIWAYVCLATQVMTRQHRAKRFLQSLIVGAVLGFGCEWLFTRVFFVDLPTLW